MGSRHVSGDTLAESNRTFPVRLALKIAAESFQTILDKYLNLTRER